MFRRKMGKPLSPKSYDRENTKPVLRCSICTGEQVAGFRNIHTGKFEEIALIGSERELREFMESYGLDHIDKEY